MGVNPRRTNMTTLQYSAVNYQPQTANKTKNICELNKVSTKSELIDDNWTDKAGKEVKQQVIVVDGVKYRVPKTVLEQLQTILKFKHDLEYFKVSKTGTTKDDTQYKVEPVFQ